METTKLPFTDYLNLDRCPHCRIDRPSLNRRHSLETSDSEQKVKKRWGVYACHRCGGVVLAYATNTIDGLKVTKVFPGDDAISGDIPERVRVLLGQARDSLHSPSGAVLLSSSAVDAMLKAKHYEEGSLYERIDRAKEANLITEGMAQWAHRIRLDANAQRHADGDIPLPTIEDGKRSLAFAMAFAEFLFVLPARVQAGLEPLENPNSP